jgi:hypothetical protein
LRMSPFAKATEKRADLPSPGFGAASCGFGWDRSGRTERTNGTDRFDGVRRRRIGDVATFDPVGDWDWIASRHEMA